MRFDSSSEFFDSEMVQASLEDIKELQDLITNSIIDTAFSSVTGYEEDELEQLDLIEELLEKQKLIDEMNELKGVKKEKKSLDKTNSPK